MDTSAVTASPLPPLYAPWLEEVLGQPVPEERHATCSSCAMCEPTNAKAATGSLSVFNPETKCCTYVPTLPNFLVGMVLKDTGPGAAAGRMTIGTRIQAGVGVTALGLQSDPRHALIYKHAGGPLFGQSSGLRCPHYRAEAGGLCGIWHHRNAVCATWFCKLERGQGGRRFWDAVRELLTLTERHLALWAARELGEAIAVLGPALLPYYATPVEPTAYTWSQRWVGQPSAFYREAATLVEPLSWAAVCQLGGPELALLAGRVRAAFGAMLSEDVPEYLRLVSVYRRARDDDMCALPSYSQSDMPLVAEQLAEALRLFDGIHATQQVCASIAAATGLVLDGHAVRRLVDFEVLRPMPQPT